MNAHEPPPAAHARYRFVAGFNEGEVLAEGWHARTRDGRCGVWMRPAEPVAHLAFRLPRAWRDRPEPVRVEALVCAAPSLLGRVVEVTIDVARGSEGAHHWAHVATWRLHQDVWVTRHVIVPADAVVQPAAAAPGSDPRPTLRLRWTTDPVLVPDAVFDNEDYRRLGVQLGSLTFARLPATPQPASVEMLDTAAAVPSLP